MKTTWRPPPTGFGKEESSSTIEIVILLFANAFSATAHGVPISTSERLPAEKGCVAPVFSRPNSPNLSLVGRWPPIWPSLAAVPSKRWLGLVAKPFWSAGLPFHWAPAARPVAERSEPNGRGAPGPSRQWFPFGLAPAAGGGGFGSYAKVMAGSSRDRGIPKPPWRRGYAAKALDETGSTADPVAGRVVGRGRAPSRATRR